MLWICALSLAASSLALPAGEDPALWTSALALGGISLGGPDSALTLLDHGELWELRVSDGHGGVRTATVTRPRNTQDREDIILLATSLLQPLTPRDPWHVVPPPPLPPLDLSYLTEKVVLTPVSEPKPLPQTVVSTTAGLPLPLPLKLYWQDAPFFEVEQRVVLHPGYYPTLGVGFQLGFRPTPWLLLGGGGGWNASADLVLRPTLRFESYRLVTEAWWTPPIRLRLGLNLAASLDHFRYQSPEQGILTYDFLNPSVGLEVGYWVPLLSGVSLIPKAGAQWEWSPTNIGIGGETVEELPPFCFNLSLSIHLGLKAYTTPDRSTDLDAR